VLLVDIATPASGGVYPRRQHRRDKPGGSPNQLAKPGAEMRFA